MMMESNKFCFNSDLALVAIIRQIISQIISQIIRQIISQIIRQGLKSLSHSLSPLKRTEILIIRLRRVR